METISKLEGAKRHLNEAIKLFFEERDPLAVHTLAAAAQGTLRGIAKVTGAEHLSILHDNPTIPAEHQRTWVNAINMPRNFFKHADKDYDGVLEFYDSDNTDTLLDAVLLYWTLSQEPLSSASVYMGWFTTKNPEMRGAISGNQIGDYCVRNGVSPDDKKQFLELIDAKILVDPI